MIRSTRIHHNNSTGAACFRVCQSCSSPVAPKMMEFLAFVLASNSLLVEFAQTGFYFVSDLLNEKSADANKNRNF
jgi:hypothetical protein